MISMDNKFIGKDKGISKQQQIMYLEASYLS